MATEVNNPLIFFPQLSLLVDSIFNQEEVILQAEDLQQGITRDDKFIILSYTYLELFEEVRKRTSYKSRMRKGNPEYAAIILTQDEADIYDSYYLQAIQEVSHILLPFSRNQKLNTLDRVACGVDELENKTYTIGELAVKDKVIYKVTAETVTVTGLTIDLAKWEATDYIYSNDKLIFIYQKFSWMADNSTDTTVIAIKEFIVGYILANWYIDALPAEAAYYMQNREGLVQRMASSLNQHDKFTRYYSFP